MCLKEQIISPVKLFNQVQYYLNIRKCCFCTSPVWDEERLVRDCVCGSQSVILERTVFSEDTTDSIESATDWAYWVAALALPAPESFKLLNLNAL